MKNLSAIVVIACLLLAACGGGTGNSSQKLSPAQMVVQVRAAGQTGNELDVQPLRDPQVDDLRAAASAAETRGDLTTAKRVLAQAARLAPNDPDLLQWQAELALASREWAQAELLATHSYEKGPKLGGLCRRNWTTIGFAREARSDASGAAQAQQRAATCAVQPPVRM